MRADELRKNMVVNFGGEWGRVTGVSGPHGPLGSPPSTDWYTVRAEFLTGRHGLEVGPPQAQGPFRADHDFGGAYTAFEHALAASEAAKVRRERGA